MKSVCRPAPEGCESKASVLEQQYKYVTYYSALIRSTEYCDERVCLLWCMCLFVHYHISGTTRPIFTKLFVLVTYGHASVLLWWRNNMLHIFGIVDDVIFAHKLIAGSTSPPD